MTYVSAADFRTATLAEFCMDISLTAAQVDDTRLAASIARMSQRVDDATLDHFESVSRTYELNGWGRPSLVLPARCTAVSTVKTRDANGTLTTQSSSVYRLVSSLNAAGTDRLGSLDYLELVPGRTLTGLNSWDWSYCWPSGAQSVQVVGTFGWTVTPTDIKRAVALLVWDNVQTRAGVLHASSRLDTVDASYTLAPTPPEAQTIIDSYTRPPVRF